MTTGFGGGPWGGDAWGGGSETLSESQCDLFGFETCDSMPNVLSNPIITPVGDSSQLQVNYPPPGTSCDLGMLSGEGSDPSFPQTTAYITAIPTSGIPHDFTLELTATFESLPNDFTNLPANHFMFQVVGPTGPCIAVFVSKAGLAYAGATHVSAGSLVLDTGLFQIPGTASLIDTGTYLTFRAVVSGINSTVYLYATATSQLGIAGHHLVAVLPTIDASNLATPPTLNEATISVAGTSLTPTRVGLDRWCLSSQLIIPNIAPNASAGQDIAARLCSIVKLDGTASFDPEGAPLLYSWRLIDAPATSEFTIEGFDGITFPEMLPTGFTDQFYSIKLGVANASDPILTGDVLAIGGEPHTIVSKGTDGNGFFVITAIADVPDSLTSSPFKLLRSRALSNAHTATPLFFPDVAGFYKFDLTVNDGILNSLPAVSIVNVVESSLPRGCLPNTQFLFNYLSDFWNLVEDADRIATLWDGIAQVTATELFTLWQHEYSKSLRDIQRTFVRRWLHYDTVLPEPIPELTKIRTIWSGVVSAEIPIAGDGSINGTELVLTSSVFETVNLPFVGSVLASEFARELLNRLLEVDSRFSVALTQNTAGTASVVTITAPFEFKVDSGTSVAEFTFGQKSGTLAGSGYPVGVKTYVVDRSLNGVDLQENDLLILNTGAYRIVRVISAPSDAYPFQRIVVKDDLPLTFPVIGSGEWRIGSQVTSQLLDFYNGLVSEGDTIHFELATATGDLTTKTATAFGVNESTAGVLSFNTNELSTELSDGSTIRLAKVLRRKYLPVSDLIVEVPALQQEIKITDQEAVLRNNLDYFLEPVRNSKAIRFIVNSIYQDGLDVWESKDPPERLWAEYSYIDNNSVIEANFGVPAGLSVEKLRAVDAGIDYLSAVRGLWYAYFKGPSPYSLRVGAQIFLGLPFAEEAGTIQEIRTDFSSTYGRILIRDKVNTEIVRSYKFPKFLNLEINPETNVSYAVGDAVSQFSPLVEGVEYIDWVKDPTWFSGLVQQGVFSEVQKYHTFSVSIDSRVFSLPALSLVRDFILQAKATYDYPIFLVRFVVDELDVDVVDELIQTVTLHLEDSTCGASGAPIYDDSRPGGAGAPIPTAWWNSFDTDGDDTTPPPTPFTPDANITWGYDSELLCPSDDISALILRTFASPTAASYDLGILRYDVPLTAYTLLTDSSVFSIPALPSAHTAASTASPSLSGNINQVLLRILGDDDGDPDDYELLITVNGSTVATLPFTAADANVVLEVPVSPVVAVLTSDTIGFKLKIRTGSASPGARTPNWTSISLRVFVSKTTVWNFDDTLPAGSYASFNQLT